MSKKPSVAEIATIAPQYTHAGEIKEAIDSSIAVENVIASIVDAAVTASYLKALHRCIPRYVMGKALLEVETAVTSYLMQHDATLSQMELGGDEPVIRLTSLF